jgi:hypothetical protein
VTSKESRKSTPSLFDLDDSPPPPPPTGGTDGVALHEAAQIRQSGLVKGVSSLALWTLS